MINLLPPQGRTSLKREYILRVGTVYAFLLTGIAITFAILLIPTYVLVSTQLNAVSAEPDRDPKVAEQYATAEKEVTNVNKLILQLRGGIPTHRISEVLSEIRKLAGPEIVFKTFQVERVQGKMQAVTIQGTASSRTALAALQSTLETSSLFDSARVPISDLARDVDLPFVITVTLDPAAQ